MKRCSRCQAVYTDEVRWCPADGTPTEAVAPAAAPPAEIPEGAPTLHDMVAVGPETAPVRPTHPNATMIGAPSPLPRMPSAPPVDNPIGDTLRGAPSPVPHNATMIGAPSPVTRQPSPTPAPPVAFSPNATMIGPQSPNPVNATMIGAQSPFAQRGPALSPELAKIAATIPSGPASAPSIVDPGPQGPSTIQGATSSDVRAPAQPTPPPPLSAPSTVPGALIPPIQTPLMSTFMGTTSEPPRTPHGSSTSSADLAAISGPKGNTFMGASPVARAPASPTPAPPLAPPSTVPGALVPPIHSPLMSTFTGTTSEPPRTPHGSPTSPADLAPSWNAQPVPPAAHTPGPVSQGWDIPDLPTETPATSPAALVAAATVDPPARSNASTLVGFAPSPEVLRAIQDQRAKVAAQQAGQTQPMAAPEIAAEAYIPSGSAPAESYASMAVAHSTAMTAMGSATDPAIPLPPLTSTMPAMSPLPMQPAVVLMASQQSSVASAISQAPLPSVSMPHPVAQAPLPSMQHEAVVVSQSMTMAAAQLPSAPKPPTASLLEAPPFQAAAAAAAAKSRSTAGDTDKHRAVGSNKKLWIVFAVLAVLMIGATIAILATR